MDHYPFEVFQALKLNVLSSPQSFPLLLSSVNVTTIHLLAPARALKSHLLTPFSLLSVSYPIGQKKSIHSLESGDTYSRKIRL